MKKTITVAEFLNRMIELSEKSQKQIAQEVGYSHPNVLSMMKMGQTKVPIEKAPVLAKALNVDPAFFVRLVMREYLPEAWRAIETNIGEPLTQNERRLVDAYREFCEGHERPVDEELLTALGSALKR